MKRLFKLILAHLFYYSGLLRLYRGVANRLHPGRTLVLVYHSVVADQEPRSSRDRASGLAVGVANFEQQMEFLAKNYTVIPLDRLARALRNKAPIPRNACVLTFDDGLEDNYRNAYPILRRLGFTATFFIPTAYVGTDRIPWNMDLEEILENLPECCSFISQLPLDLFPEEIIGLLNQFATDRSLSAKRQLMETLKQLPSDQINQILTILRDRSGLGPVEAKRMTLNWDEIRRMVASGMSVGGHTQNHRILPMEPEELAQNEINGSKLDLESHLDSLIEGFAYPNGGYTPQIQQLVQQAGYEYACSMEENSASFHSDRYALPRRDVNEVKSTRINGEFSPAVFEATIQGIFNHPMKWLRRSGVQERFHHGRQKCSAVNS